MSSERSADEQRAQFPDSCSMLSGPTDAQHVLRSVPVVSMQSNENSSTSNIEGGE